MLGKLWSKTEFLFSIAARLLFFLHRYQNQNFQINAKHFYQHFNNPNRAETIRLVNCFDFTDSMFFTNNRNDLHSYLSTRQRVSHCLALYHALFGEYYSSCLVHGELAPARENASSCLSKYAHVASRSSNRKCRWMHGQ